MNIYPSYCCQKCGLEIGWLGRVLEFILPKLFGFHHPCQRKRYKMQPADKNALWQVFWGIILGVGGAWFVFIFVPSLAK